MGAAFRVHRTGGAGDLSQQWTGVGDGPDVAPRVPIDTEAAVGVTFEDTRGGGPGDASDTVITPLLRSTE